jgi:hypothetical protein
MTHSKHVNTQPIKVLENHRRDLKDKLETHDLFTGSLLTPHERLVFELRRYSRSLRRQGRSMAFSAISMRKLETSDCLKKNWNELFSQNFVFKSSWWMMINKSHLHFDVFGIVGREETFPQWQVLLIGTSDDPSSL